MYLNPIQNLNVNGQMENDHGPCTVAPYNIASEKKESKGPT